MLKQLRIENFAIVKEAHLDFEKGLTIISGETGAGKSIIVDALTLISGGTADETLIKSDSDTAIVEAVFDCAILRQFLPTVVGEQDPIILSFIEEEETLVIFKKLSRHSQTITRINTQTVPLKTLKSLATYLLQITSQHDTNQLFSTHFQRQAIDAYAGQSVQPLLKKYKTAFQDYQRLTSDKKALDTLNQDPQHLAFLDFQIADIAEQNFTKDEETELDQHVQTHKNAHQRHSLYSNGTTYLASARSSLQEAEKNIHQLSEIDSNFKSFDTSLKDISLLLDETTQSLRHNQPTDTAINIDDANSRLDLIFKYKQKYKAQTLESLLETLARIQSERDQLLAAEETRSRLNRDIDLAYKQALSFAKSLSLERQRHFSSFETQLTQTLHDLNMEGAQFKISCTPSEQLHPEGIDDIQFLLSPNPGETLKAIQKIASGGELSRVLLALKTLHLREFSVPTIIFDEIDTGIGGITATKIGTILTQLAEKNQVICITHLPQIAQVGQHHIALAKQSTANSTEVTMTHLSSSEKDQELKRMQGLTSVSTTQ